MENIAVKEELKVQQTLMDYIKSEFLNQDEQLKFEAGTTLVSSRIMDSISTLQLVDFIEKTFQIEFEHHEVDEDNLDTVEKMSAFVMSKKGE
jgi:D-alanine--poly(phosphoribitol) ligase subunit 2